MRTLSEIEQAIESLPVGDLDALTNWLLQRRRELKRWPVPPPDVPREEIRRIQAEIDREFSTVGPAK